MKQKSIETVLFNIFAISFATLFSILCLLPILLTVSGSFTPEQELLRGLKLIPNSFTTAAYRMVVKDFDAMINAYGVTIKLVVIGTALSLLITTMTAYVLYRRDFPARNFFAFFFFFTTLFSGGLVPHYVWYSEIGLRNTFTVLLIVSVFSVFNMIVVRSYFTAILEKVPVIEMPVEQVSDHESIKNSATVFIEAETADKIESGTIYNTRAFMSGGAGITKHDNTGTNLVYTVDIPKDGDYTLALNYVAWEETSARSGITIDGKSYDISLPKTASWGAEPSDWRAAVAQNPIHLKAGKYTMYIEALEGMWNVDWI